MGYSSVSPYFISEIGCYL